MDVRQASRERNGQGNGTVWGSGRHKEALPRLDVFATGRSAEVFDVTRYPIDLTDDE